MVSTSEKDISYPIVSIPLINYYLNKHGLKNELFDIENKNDIELIKLSERDSLLLIGNFKKKFSDHYILTHDSTYYHNPYVNRMWSKVETFRLEKK